MNPWHRVPAVAVAAQAGSRGRATTTRLQCASTFGDNRGDKCKRRGQLDADGSEDGGTQDGLDLRGRGASGVRAGKALDEAAMERESATPSPT